MPLQNNLKIRMFSTYVTEKAIERAANTLRSGYIGEGKEVAILESRFKEIIGADYPVAVNSGTSALHLALVVAGIKPGDEVITTAQTMAATSHAIMMQFAKPVFADIQYETGNINPDDIEHRITEKTKAILPVHWAGYPCDMDEIHKIAEKHNLAVIEDAAHAIGAEYKGKKIGTVSPCACFSFQAIKHITTGDGGMVCFGNKEKYDEGRRRRWFGIDRINRKESILGEPEWNVSEVGYKYHMNDIAASLGIENLSMLNEIIERRRQIAKWYREEFEGLNGIRLMKEKNDRKSAFWLFTIHVERKIDFIKMMRKKGIEVSVVHNRIDTNNIFGPLRKDLPELEKYTETHICIPIHNSLKDDEVKHIINSVREGR